MLFFAHSSCIHTEKWKKILNFAIVNNYIDVCYLYQSR